MKLIGTTAETIFKAEDRQAFKDTMEKIGELQVILVLRPAYTLGGSGGGIAHNETELIDILSNGLRFKPCRRSISRALYRRLEGNRIRSNA